MSDEPDFASRFLEGLRKLVERAWRSRNWEMAARAFQAGLSDSRTRVGTFSCLAEVVMKRLFVFRDSEGELGEFLRGKLFVAPEMVQPLKRIAVDAAAKALQVSRSELSFREAAEAIAREHGADLQLASSVLDAALGFLERYRFSWGRLAFALLMLLGHPVVAVPLSLGLGAAVLLVGRRPWWLAAAAAFGAYVFLSVVQVVGAAGVRGKPRKPHAGK